MKREERRETGNKAYALPLAQVLLFFVSIQETFWRSRGILLPGRAPLLLSTSFLLSLPIKLLGLRDSSLLREKQGMPGLE